MFCSKKIIKSIILACLCALVPLLYISTKGIWIDEGIVYNLINGQTSLIEMIKGAIHSAGSEKQMPFYLIYEWFWTRAFGTSEYIMRLSNYPFALIYMYFAYKIINTMAIRQKHLFFMLFMFNPIFAYYMNEARPYMIILSLTMALIYYSFYSLDFGSKINLFKIHSVIFWGIGTHILFIFTSIIYLVALVRSLLEKTTTVLKHVKVLCLCVPAYILLFGYTLMTMIDSSHISIGSGTNSFIVSVVISLYYLLGYGGLFLSRNDMRGIELDSITPFMIIATISLTVVYFFIAIRFIRSTTKEKQSNKKLISLLTSAAAILICFIFLSIFCKYNFWERHVIALSALFIVFLGEVFVFFNGHKNKTHCIIGILALIYGIASFRIVQDPYYMNEDYKNALNALQKKQSVVLAQGTNFVFPYYGYRLVNFSEWKFDDKENVIDINNFTEEKMDRILSQLLSEHADHEIDVILTSRTFLDANGLYDKNNIVAKYKATYMTFPGLKMYRIKVQI